MATAATCQWALSLVVTDIGNTRNLSGDYFEHEPRPCATWAVHSIMWLVIRCGHVAKAAIVWRAKQSLALEAPLSMRRSTDSCAGNGAEFATVS